MGLTPRARAVLPLRFRLYYLRSVYAARSIAAALLDAACQVCAFTLTWLFVQSQLSGIHCAMLTLVSVGISCALLFFNGAYTPETLGDGQRTTTSILATMGLGLAAAVILYFVVPVPEGVNPTLASAAGIFFPLMFVARMVFRLLLGTALLTTNVVVIGATDLGLRIGQMLDERREAGIRLIGFLSDDLASRERSPCRPNEARFGTFPVIGQVDELEKILAARSVDYVVVASKDRHEHFPEATLMRAKMRGVRIESGVSFLERLSGRVYMRDLRLNYLIFGEGFSRGWVYKAIQRSLDLIGASVLLAISLPALCIAAVAIKLESPGPVLYRQRRLGKDDKTFMMYKLRSMREDAESASGAVFTSEDDDRITGTGYFIRRVRLDELPQLWNVLRGEMSLVGPRAERPEFAEMLSEHYRYYCYRTSVLPGITGWAQTRYGYVNNVEAYEEKLALDLYYLKYRNTFLDLTILAQTIKTVLHFRGL